MDLPRPPSGLVSPRLVALPFWPVGCRAMKLPRASHVRIEERKVRGYLLCSTHPVGRFKARVFAALGFDQGNAQTFTAEIRRIAADGDISDGKDTVFGRMYTVPGELRGAAGIVQVLTVWIDERGKPDLRLVTVRPRWP